MASISPQHVLHTPTFVNKDVSKLIAVPDIQFRTDVVRVSASSETSFPAAVSTTVSPELDSGSRPAFTATAVKSHTARVDTDQITWEYDVYAKPFVPSVLKNINVQEAQVITTPAKHRIDYEGYYSTFTGISFEPCEVSHAPCDVLDRSTLSMTQLRESTYLQFFKTMFEGECAAQRIRNNDFALYSVPMRPLVTPTGTYWALSVPGLREDSPHVEIGDVVQIRHLWYEGSPDFQQTSTYMHSQTSTGKVFANWTGYQHDAAVHNINRTLELVYLDIEAFEYLLIRGERMPLVVNVVFPLKFRYLSAQQSALVCIASDLQQMIRSQEIRGGSEITSFIKSTAWTEQDSVPLDQETHNDWIRRMLLPTKADGVQQTRLRDIPHRALFDNAINYEQAHAVKAICSKDYGTLPYLISGPPGTGKTKTLVETVMQLLNTTSIAHILICAPSESAADTLTLRLKQHLNTEQLLRLNNPGRAEIEVPQELLQYCYMESDMFYIPPIKQLMTFNVVVTSCRDSAILADAHVTNVDLWNLERDMASTFHPEDPKPMPKLHWGALLVDEAAQATEMDILPALTVVRPPLDYPTTLTQPLFVMAGDENQLGPKTALQDFEVISSLFARLFQRPLYSDHPLSRSNTKPSCGPPVLKRSMLPMIHPPFANLTRNYRSHPAILSVPSLCFYNDTLIPEAATAVTPLQSSSLWCGRRWPVLFVPNTSADEIERDGGGWYNLIEARIACSLAQRLIDECAVHQADICIISPFAAQVKCLRKMIRSGTYGGGSGLWEVNIGPLEAFQGLEKRVVILCTTRTRERFLDEDTKRGLGIVHQKRKMNVALTRAKEALLVIGHPGLLGKDEHWRQWLAFCWRNGLVSDPNCVWKGDEENFGKERIGILEKAMVTKEMNSVSAKKGGLGAAVDAYEGKEEYEAWLESLRVALDEEEESEASEHDGADYEEEDAIDVTSETTSGQAVRSGKDTNGDNFSKEKNVGTTTTNQ